MHKYHIYTIGTPSYGLGLGLGLGPLTGMRTRAERDSPLILKKKIIVHVFVC